MTTYPSGAVSLDSPFYIERSLVEKKIYQEIDRPGALTRIKASEKMGKTSLLFRILDYAVSRNYHIVTFNFDLINYEILSDLNRFLRFVRH